MITLVIGGTRSGKSQIAERLAARAGVLTVLVPAVATDPDFLRRIEEHRARRPDSWTTIECGAGLVRAVLAVEGPVLIDSLGSWVAATEAFTVDADQLVAALRARSQPTVVVSEEVGLSVHAPTESGRRFVDVLGALNTAVAEAADEVLFVVASRVVRLESLANLPVAEVSLMREIPHA